jgi:hypothetical protein
VQPNGAVEGANARVQPGARVVVPESPADEERTNWAQVVTAVSSFVTSVLAIAVLARQL